MVKMQYNKLILIVIMVLLAVNVNAVYRETADEYGNSGNWNNASRLNDTDYNTLAYAMGGIASNFYANYSNRGNQTGTPILQAKDGNAMLNISLVGCDLSPIQIKATSSGTGWCYWYCYDNGGWSKKRQRFPCGGGAGNIYEEGLFWDEQTTLDNCSTFSNVLINFSSIDETSLNDVSITLDLEMNAAGISNFSNQYDATDQKVVCIDNYFNGVVSGSMTYANDDSYDEFYYVWVDGNKTSNVTLYALNSSNTSTTEIIATVLDETNNPLQYAYIKVLKYYYSDNTYKLVEMGRTNWEGQTRLHLIKHTEYYKFLIYYPYTTLVKTTSPAQIYADSDKINFQVQLNNLIAEDYRTAQNIDYSLVFNNATDNFRFTFSDNSGTTREYCLAINKISALENTQINGSCMTGAAGVMLLGVPPVNGTTYLAKVTVDLNGPYLLASKSQTYNAAPALGLMGIFIIMVLVLLFGFISFWNLSVAAIMIPLPILMGSLAGIIALPFGIAIIFEIIGVFIAILLEART